MRGNVSAPYHRAELPGCLRTATTPDGRRVRARCFACGRTGRARYEIVIDGLGSRAVVDVAHRADIAVLMADAMGAFATAQRLLRAARPGSAR